MSRPDGACNYCNGGSLNACEYLTRNSVRIQCAACGGSGLAKDDDRLAEALRLIDAQDAWARRLNAIKDKHERTGGPDEQQLADWGRSS